MNENLEKQFQESESEWAEIEKSTAIRKQKDKRKKGERKRENIFENSFRSGREENGRQMANTVMQ